MQQPRHFDEIADRYDETIPCHVSAHYLRKRVAVMRALFGEGCVLDVGCGTGALAQALNAAGTRAFGVDGSAEMLRVMRSRRRGQGVRALSPRLPFRTNAFDGAVCVAVLHHLAEAAAVSATVAEMVRVTRPGGHVVIWDHNPANPYWPHIMARVPQDRGDERLVSEGEIVAALRDAGVERCRVCKMGLVPDFAPKWLLWLFGAMEFVFERTPLLRMLCAHNVVVARK